MTLFIRDNLDNRNRKGQTYETFCRYCGEVAFYYKKEHSRHSVSHAFFEDLGKPWEKHHCKEFANTDQKEFCISRIGSKRDAETKKIYWVKEKYKWYKLNDVSEDIHSLHHKGVYIIWYFNTWGTASTVKVGNGPLWECLKKESRDSRVERYAADRTLYVTWALVLSDYRDDIAIYLSEKLDPFVRLQYPRNTAVRLDGVELPSAFKQH